MLRLSLKLRVTRLSFLLQYGPVSYIPDLSATQTFGVEVGV